MATTIEQFENDVSEIALKLVQAYGLTYEATSDGMALQRWMDYRLRHVSPQPRKVEKSVLFPIQNLPEEVGEALCNLERMFENGEDVNPYLSKTTIGNDVSASKHQRRTDGLWADWRIHHLHLTTAPLEPNKRFSERSNWLLFVMVYEDVVAFIDVRHHSEKDLWTQVDLFKTFIDSWPEQAEPYRVVDMHIDTPAGSATDHKLLRNAGVNIPVEHNGEQYFGPGKGITAAITSTAATMDCNKVERSARGIALWLDQPENKIRADLKQSGISDPQFCLSVGNHGLSIGSPFVKEKVWNLPEFDQRGNRSDFGVLKDRLMPAWAVPTLMKFLTSTP